MIDNLVIIFMYKYLKKNQENYIKISIKNKKSQKLFEINI